MRRRPCRRAPHAERALGERDGAGAGRTTTMRRGPGRTRPRRPRAGRAASAPARSRERARRRRSPRLRECRRRGRTRPSSPSADNSPRALRSRRRARTRCPGRACPRAQANPLVVERYSLSPRATVASVVCDVESGVPGSSIVSGWFRSSAGRFLSGAQQASSGATKRLDSHVPPSVGSSLSLDGTARKRSQASVSASHRRSPVLSLPIMVSCPGPRFRWWCRV